MDLVMGESRSGTYIKSWEPSVEEESCNGVNMVLLRTKHLTNGKIFLCGEVTDEMANDFILQATYLAERKQPFTVYINTPGGSVNAGLAIYDTIQICSKEVAIDLKCTGMAASMGAVLLAGGPKGHRFILPHSKVMIHEPLISNGVGGSATTIKKTAETILETKALTNSILAKHTGKSVEEIDRATSFDNYMNAQEAITFGICDAVCNSI